MFLSILALLSSDGRLSCTLFHCPVLGEYYIVRHGARHDVWSDGEREIVIPRHNDINEYTAKAILKEAGGD
jgi:hypothetical protein